MGVLVFDIDGTLTETSQVDGEYFAKAVQASLPEAEIDPSRTFPEFTDAAILRAICTEVGEVEYDAVQPEVIQNFIAGLEAAVQTRPDAFAPVAGARRIFEEVGRAGWTPAVATGGWRESAELKLSVANIPTAGVPVATSSDRIRRVDIIRLAVSKAASPASLQDVVYVGDGIWDVQACRELGIGFVGRGLKPEDHSRLLDHGARVVLADFTEPGHLLELLADPAALRPAGATG